MSLIFILVIFHPSQWLLIQHRSIPKLHASCAHIYAHPSAARPPKPAFPRVDKSESPGRRRRCAPRNL